MEETDEYYNLRFMNNQSLDTIVYGNDAMNTDERLETIISSLEEDYSLPEDNDDNLLENNPEDNSYLDNYD